MTAPELDLERGIVRLSRSHLRALLIVDSERLAELEAIGVVVEGRPHPALADALATLRRPAARFLVRTWRAGRRLVTAGYVGKPVVVALPVVDNAETVVDVRVHPRVTSLARVVAGVLELPAASYSTVVVPNEPLSWEEVLAPALTGEPGWTQGLIEDPEAVTVHDLRWSADGRDRPATVLVLAILGPTLVEIRPTETDDRYQLVPRHPLEIWTGLCRMTADARIVGRRDGT